jgi:hypothetical protein
MNMTATLDSPRKARAVFGRSISGTMSSSPTWGKDIQGVDKIMETLRNWGIQFVLATFKEGGTR